LIARMAILDGSNSWVANRFAGDVADLVAAAMRRDTKAQLAVMMSCKQ